MKVWDKQFSSYDVNEMCWTRNDQKMQLVVSIISYVYSSNHTNISNLFRGSQIV